jgi:molecular chaperone GrpE
VSQEIETGSQDPENNGAEAPLEPELMTSEAESDGEKVQRELADANEQVLRVQAEMQNVRRRTQRDIENAHKFALEKFVSALLPVIDNLERALSTIDGGDEAQKPVAEGLQLTLKSFVDALSNFKVEQVDPAGQPFDADLHQAVSMLPNADIEANTVMDVFQKGYTLHGRLVRPAMVTVSKAP